MMQNLMNKKKKGQALVEFIIILPIFLFLIFGLIDFGKILYIKNELTVLLPEVKEMYKDKTYEEIEKYVRKNNKDNKISITTKDENVTFEIYRNLNIVTPGLNLIIGNPYKVTASLIINNESTEKE